MAKRKVPLPISTLAQYAEMLEIEFELPTDVYEGVGKVIAAHAILEMTVSQLGFDLMGIDYPQGRVAFKYVAASTMFSTIRRLIDLHGIEPNTNLTDLESAIGKCCSARDQLAHGVWLRTKTGEIELRLSEGKYESPAGTHDRAFLPPTKKIEPGDYGERKTAILACIERVKALQAEVKTALHRSS